VTTAAAVSSQLVSMPRINLDTGEIARRRFRHRVGAVGLTQFGCLRNVLLAEPGDLMSVPGVGPAKARAIHALGSEQPAIPAKPE
jgi:DNA repair protein RadC